MDVGDGKCDDDDDGTVSHGLSFDSNFTFLSFSSDPVKGSCLMFGLFSSVDNEAVD